LTTDDKATKSKPDSRRYLEAEELHVKQDHCFAFEESFAGIQTGTSAHIKIIGSATTNSSDALKGKYYLAIPNFKEFCYESHVNKAINKICYFKSF